MKGFMSCNEADTRAKLIVTVLVLAVGIGTFIQFLENHKMYDEPLRIPYVPTYTMANSTYAGTASITTMTL